MEKNNSNKTYYICANICEGKQHLKKAMSSEIQYYYENAKKEYLYAINYFKTAEQMAIEIGSSKLKELASNYLSDAIGLYNNLKNKIKQKEETK